jgi:hypothetical protein
MKTVLFLLLLGAVAGRAQTPVITPADVQRKQSYLIMRDSSVVRGRVLRQDSSLITVRKRNRELTFVEADQLVRVVANRPDKAVGLVGFRPVGPTRLFVLKDGSSIEGQFVRRDSTMITVRKRNGQMTYFEPEQLARMDTVALNATTDGSRFFANRFAPWLLTGLTAVNPDKGQFYYRNTWLLLHEFQYGITRHWSVGARFTTPIPYLILGEGYFGSGLLERTEPQLITKLSAALGPRFRLGVNTTYQPNLYKTYPSRPGVWTFQALATIGSSQRNVTVGYGITVPKTKLIYYTYQPITSSAAPQYTYIYAPNRTFLTVGISQKIKPGLTFISDNAINLGRQSYYYDNANGRASLSAALRIDRQRHSFDLGVFSLIYQHPYLWDGKKVRFFPYVGYNLLIGRD